MTQVTEEGVFWLENQYKTNNICNGAPDAIYMFYTSDPAGYDQPESETWPTMYR